MYLADSCLISRFFALFTSLRSRVLAYSSFSCSCDVFLSFACPRLLANSGPRLYCVLAIYSRKLAFSYSRIRVFFTFSLIILANSHSRPERENTRERGYEVRRISHHTSDWPRVGRKRTSMDVGAVSIQRDPRKSTKCEYLAHTANLLGMKIAWCASMAAKLYISQETELEFEW